jgi:hypothetical protein
MTGMASRGGVWLGTACVQLSEQGPESPPNTFLGIVANWGPGWNGVPLCDSIGTTWSTARMQYTNTTWARQLRNLSVVLNDRQ